MAKKPEEPNQLLEREYVVPLRKGWLKVPKYKRTNKAVKTLKEFVARHMKVYDKDLRKVKLNVDLNNEMRFRGMKKPPSRIKIKAKKFDDGIVRVEMVDVPKHIEFARLRAKKSEAVVKKKEEDKKEEKAEEKKDKDDKNIEEKEDKTEEKKEEKEKKKVVKEVEPKAKEKHVSKTKEVRIQRKALAR